MSKSRRRSDKTLGNLINDIQKLGERVSMLEIAINSSPSSTARSRSPSTSLRARTRRQGRSQHRDTTHRRPRGSPEYSFADRMQAWKGGKRKPRRTRRRR